MSARFAGLFLLLCVFFTAQAEDKAPLGEKKPDSLNVALVAMKSMYSDSADAKANRAAIEANLKHHQYFIDLAAASGAEFVGFPEMSVSGYHFSDKMTWLKLDGPEIKVLCDKAKEKLLYIGAGVAEVDENGKHWNTQIVISPKGEIIGKHHKIWLTAEKGIVEVGTDHNVFDVKGVKMGISICADGTDPKNLEKLAENGAKIIYGPHANTTGGTIAGWYKFRAAWAGPEGLMAKLKTYGVLCNNAGLYAEHQPPAEKDSNTGWASGAWFIGSDGKTLAQMPSSTNRADSKECVLYQTIPIGQK